MPSLPENKSKKPPLWAHALIMLVVAPLTYGLIMGAMHGFALPVSAGAASLKIAEWVGSAMIALLIGLLSLLFRKPNISWAITFGLIGFSAYTVYYEEQQLGRVNRDQDSTKSQPANTIIVSEAVESIPGFTEAMINPAIIRKMELLLISDTERNTKLRAKEAGVNIDSIGITASSMLFEQNGERAVITELHYPPSVQGPNLKVIWWTQSNQIKRVYCVDPSGDAVNFRRGECGLQIAKTFGYSKWYTE